MVEIVRVKNKKDRKRFINFENKLYAECDYFIPDIYKTSNKLFNVKKNPSLLSNESTAYIAFQEGKVVGRVLCFFNRIEKQEKNLIRFSHLDFINDSEVSFALFDTIEKWARFLKSDRIIGDISFNDLGNIGVLSSGFKSLSTYHHRYNFSYYSEHLKNYGYSQSKKLTEYQLHLNNLELTENAIPESLHKVEGEKDFKIKYYARKLFDLLYDKSISGYPTVIEEKVYEEFFKKLNKLYSSDEFVIITNDNDDVVGGFLLTNNTSLALQTTGGKVMASKKMYNVDFSEQNQLDLAIFVAQNKEIENILFNQIVEIMKKRNIEFLNANLWLGNIEKETIETYFEIVWSRQRVVMSKKLPIIKRDKEDMIANIHKPNKNAIM